MLSPDNWQKSMILLKKVELLIILTIFFSACRVIQYKMEPNRPDSPIEKVPPPPFEDAFWIRGEWVWSGPNHGYVWHQGRYVKPHENADWVRGHWRETRRGWKWVSGHWER